MKLRAPHHLLRTTVLAAAVLSATGLAACTDKADKANAVAVTGTDDSCDLERTDLAAGTIDFEFTNEGKKVSELYVVREDGDIVGEVENVTPNLTRTLKADLVAGEYKVRCKPGQTGDGIETEFTVSGKGGTPQAKADRTVTFDAADFTYQDLDLDGITKGTTVRFEMTNSGTQAHEFEVLDPSGEAIGEVAAIEPGKTGGATMTFEEAGTYTYQCILKDAKTHKAHDMLGMTGTFEVKAA
jgi:plastocyanin